MSRSVFIGGFWLRVTLGSLSADGRGCVPPPVGCLAWGLPALDPAGCWVGSGVGAKMATSGRAYADGYSLGCLPMSLPLQWATASPCLPGRPSKTHREVWPQLLWSDCFALGPSAHENLCALSKSGVSVFPSLVELQHSSPTGLQNQCSGGSSQCQTPQAGEPDMGLRTLIPVGDPLQYDYFPVCGLPTWQVWNWIRSWQHPSYHLVVASSLSLGVECLFLVDSSLFCW